MHGARAYVSPDWYEDPGLPTYNFSVAHLEGPAEAMTDPAELRAHLVELVRVHEEAKPAVDAGPWQIDAVADARIDALLPAVMGFRITVDSAHAKTKFGQNRSHDDRVATREHLHRSPAAEDREIAERMDDAVDAPTRGGQVTDATGHHHRKRARRHARSENARAQVASGSGRVVSPASMTRSMGSTPQRSSTQAGPSFCRGSSMRIPICN